MFERFTEGARVVVVLAQDEARLLRHNYIGTEHFLLGLLREKEGLAARVLESLDITLEEVRAQVVRIIGQGDELATGQIPFTPRAKKVLDLSLREALSLGHNYIGTEHLLLGLLRENDGVAPRILLDFDADAEKVRNEIIRMLSGPEAPHREALAEPFSSKPYEPQSSAIGPEVGEELERLRRGRAAAIEAQDLDKAAEMQWRELRLTAAAMQLDGTWRSRHDPVELDEGVVFPSDDASGSVTVSVGGRVPGPYNPFTYFDYIGLAFFGVAGGIGLFVGWLIWG